MKGSCFRLPVLGVALVLLALGCSREPSQLTEPGANNPSGPAPLITGAPGAKVVPNSYIVVFKQTVTDVDGVVDGLHTRAGITAKFRYKHAIKGFAASLTLSQVDSLRYNPNVAYIQRNGVMHTTATQLSPPSWGLNRIDQLALPLDNTYTYGTSGRGVDAYIIDTGIRITHLDFGGRAVVGFDAVTPGGSAEDGHGHGTHVAGTVGGSLYGVAKGVNLIAVRVLDDTGWGEDAQVIAGIDWVTADHTTHPAVANMSIGGGPDPATDEAVRNSIADGVVYCVSAGNDQFDSSNKSPARVAEAITVGATDINDGWAWFSNFGNLVDILAPGVAITSAWNASDTAANTISGTSMATPHVTGAAALYLEANPTATPAQVATALTSAATAGAISGVPAGTVNLLLYSLVAAVPPPAAPVLTSPANGATGVWISPTLTWRASAPAATYQVQVSTSSAFTTMLFDQPGLALTSTTVTNLAPRTRYYWRVNATSALRTGPWSTISGFTTGVGYPTPTAPSPALPANGSTVTTRTPTLSWNASANATSYRVQISTRSSFSTLAYNRAGITSTSVPTSALTDRTLYYWRVNATNASGTSAYSPTWSFRIRQ